MPAPWPPLFGLYRTGGRLFLPLLKRRLTAKHLAEGGDAARVRERFGTAGLPRPEGRLIWVHAVSVGEALSVLDLCKSLSREAEILLTTTSVTSAELIKARLPDRVRHQFAPIDSLPCVRRFLDHWRPDLMILTESELWPVTIEALARRQIPVAMVNGRMSEKSAADWSRRAPRLARAAMSRIDCILTQDAASARAFVRLGADPSRVRPGASLKALAERLPVDPDARDAALVWTGTRPAWLAASTHEGEEEIVLGAHRSILSRTPEALLILAPRHPNRADSVAGLIEHAGLTAARRSRNETPTDATNVYLADTLGEMGLWFDLCVPVLMGGSLLPGIGGHNPVEPAQFGCAIVTGPHIANAKDLFDGLIDAGLAEIVEADSLAPAIEARFSHTRQPPPAQPDEGLEDTARTLLAFLP